MRRMGEDEAGMNAREPRADRSFDVMEAIDLLGRRLGGALVLAGAFIGIGVYYSGGGGDEAPGYQGFAADGEVFRLNLESGSIIACNSARCTQILRRGQDLTENASGTLFKTPPGAGAPGLPQLPVNPQQPAGQQQLAPPASQPQAPALPAPPQQ